MQKQISQVISAVSCGCSKEQLESKLRRIKLREGSDSGSSCRWCEYRDTILLDPSNPGESEREFICRKHDLKFLLKVGELSRYTCDDFMNDKIANAGMQAFAISDKTNTQTEKKFVWERIFKRK